MSEMEKDFTNSHRLEMVKISCGCGGVYAVTLGFYNAARGSTHKRWVCPYCRQEYHFNMSQEEYLRDEIAQLEKNRDHLVRLLNKKRRSATAYKTHFRRAKKQLNDLSVDYDPTRRVSDGN